MRPSFVTVLLLVLLGISLLVWREIRLTRQLAAMQSEIQELAAQTATANARLDGVESRMALLQPQNQFAAVPSYANSTAPAAERLSALETHLRNLTDSLARIPAGRLVPEYDPTQAPPPELTADTSTNKFEALGYSPEQIIGPPDLERAGDNGKAWCHLKSSSGSEWLAAGFNQEVEVAEVRIRESYNPGAITRVTAIVNGHEIVLWEGAALKGSMLRDFVVRPPFNVRSRSVVVHFDTTRILNWTEIDSVELVGRDGSRQWASSASASSTYAEQGQSTRYTLRAEQ